MLQNVLFPTSGIQRNGHTSKQKTKVLNKKTKTRAVPFLLRCPHIKHFNYYNIAPRSKSEVCLNLCVFSGSNLWRIKKKKKKTFSEAFKPQHLQTREVLIPYCFMRHFNLNQKEKKEKKKKGPLERMTTNQKAHSNKSSLQLLLQWPCAHARSVA